MVQVTVIAKEVLIHLLLLITRTQISLMNIFSPVLCLPGRIEALFHSLVCQSQRGGYNSQKLNTFGMKLYSFSPPKGRMSLDDRAAHKPHSVCSLLTAGVGADSDSLLCHSAGSVVPYSAWLTVLEIYSFIMPPAWF